MSGLSVSVVIPVYNGERFAAEAIDSVLGQTRAPDEVLVVDDGSTDGTPEVLRRFDRRVTLIRQQNAGAAAARNRGIEAAKGALIAFQDADDLWVPHKLEHQIAAFTADPALDVCAALVEHFWEPGLAQREAAYRQVDHPMTKPQVGWILQTMVVRRDAFRRVGLLDESLMTCEDVDWCLRGREAGLREHVVPEVLVRRRIHGDNLTMTHEAVVKSDLVSVFAASLKRRRGR